MDQFNMALNGILGEVAEEVNRASDLHPPMNSMHEAYAVILEELDEFWQEVKKKQPNPVELQIELKQIAAMAIRAQIDLLPN